MTTPWQWHVSLQQHVRHVSHRQRLAGDVTVQVAVACHESARGQPLAPRALALLLFGNDPARAKRAASTRLRRHTATRVFGIAEREVASDSVRRVYETRTSQDLNMQTRAIDLGQYAGETSAACFWLAVAAGIAHIRWAPSGPGSAGPGGGGGVIAACTGHTCGGDRHRFR